MNFQVLFAVIVFFLSFFAANCCSTKNDYHYNVLECSDVQIQALGDHILEKLRGEREIRPNTCRKENISFLRKAPFTKDKDYDGRKLCAVWQYKHVKEPGTTFSGTTETLEALKNGRTWNVMIDKRFNVHRYILRNSTNGEMSEVFMSEDELMTKFTNEMFWNHMDIVQCQNFLFYISKEYNNQIVSFSVVDKHNSNQELRFIMETGGIGGFYKLEDDKQENGNEDKDASDDGSNLFNEQKQVQIHNETIY